MYKYIYIYGAGLWKSTLCMDPALDPAVQLCDYCSLLPKCHWSLQQTGNLADEMVDIMKVNRRCWKDIRSWVRQLWRKAAGRSIPIWKKCCQAEEKILVEQLPDVDNRDWRCGSSHLHHHRHRVECSPLRRNNEIPACCSRALFKTLDLTWCISGMPLFFLKWLFSVVTVKFNF